MASFDKWSADDDNRWREFLNEMKSGSERQSRSDVWNAGYAEGVRVGLAAANSPIGSFLK